LIFISHSSRDTWVAKQLAAHIEAAGADVFLDEANIDVGSEFEREILAALREADDLIVLLTPWALDRPFVWAEIGGAWLRGIRIVGVLLGSHHRTSKPVPPFRSCSRAGT
jgi:nucleotide-binding universal stress UspA family protein